MLNSQPEKELIFALDIGTRSVIGIVGEARGEMFHVLHMAKEEHTKRAMLDGQIEDIDQVARIVSIVKERLEEQVGAPLTRVCVAAAGRSLQMERARAVVELPKIFTITDDLISQLEAVAIAEAEEKLSEHNQDQRFYLVGYTVAQYLLDRYPMTTIKGHNGQLMEADVVATFLPSQVVEGLYAVVQMAGLEVASLTLEPIAALNATIPPDLRLLNLVLVDIGAGTSDIAVCRDGSVVGYTMATTAGDEITEMLMKHYLVDFQTAERLKVSLDVDSIKYTDVLGLEQITSGPQVRDAMEPAAKTLVREIAKQVIAINGCAPSAVFMAGGGSKLEGITDQLATTLEVESRRIAVAGTNYNRTIVAENFQLDDPEYATPLGIAVSAGLGLINDSYHITLNGKGAKLFRSGSLTILDILMMNGYTAAALIGRTGKNLAIMINGNKKIIRGKPAIPGVLRLNGEPAVASTLVRAADSIDFVPAIDGLSASTSLKEFLGDYTGRVLLNGQEVSWDTPLRSGDSITTLSEQGAPAPQRRGTRSLTEEELTPLPTDENGKPILPGAEDTSWVKQTGVEDPNDTKPLGFSQDQLGVHQDHTVEATFQGEPHMEIHPEQMHRQDFLGEQPQHQEFFQEVHPESLPAQEYHPEMQPQYDELHLNQPTEAPVAPPVYPQEPQPVAPVTPFAAPASFAFGGEPTPYVTDAEEDVKIYSQEKVIPLPLDATLTQADFTRQPDFTRNHSANHPDGVQQMTTELPAPVLLETAYNGGERVQPTGSLPRLNMDEMNQRTGGFPVLTPDQYSQATGAFPPITPDQYSQATGAFPPLGPGVLAQGTGALPNLSQTGTLPNLSQTGALPNLSQGGNLSDFSQTGALPNLSQGGNLSDFSQTGALPNLSQGGNLSDFSQTGALPNLAKEMESYQTGAEPGAQQPASPQLYAQEPVAEPISLEPPAPKIPVLQGEVFLNGKQVHLPPKPDGSPYYLMDLLDKTDIDFRRASRPIRTLVNGAEGFFVQQIYAGDQITIEEQ